MINVKLFRDGNGSIVKVSALGHSGLGEHGNDILCAAASALIQTAYLAVKDIGGDVSYKRNADKGAFEFTINSVPDRHDADVILRAMLVGLNDLSSGYPQNLKTEELTCL